MNQKRHDLHVKYVKIKFSETQSEGVTNEEVRKEL